MGLDMYLHAKKYISKVNWDMVDDFDNPSVRHEFDNVVSAAGLSDVATDIYGAEVSVTAAYWRKVNAIHAWFVKNVQNEEDDCREYYVPREKLSELREVCRKTLFDKNPDLLPPQSGFFFGSYDIDEWYWEGIKNTIKQIDRVLNIQDDSLSFYYQSSW